MARDDFDDDVLSSRDIKKLSATLYGSNYSNIKDTGQVRKSVSFLADMQRDTDKKLKFNEVGYSGGISDIDKSAKNIMAKLGYLVSDISKATKKMLTSTTAGMLSVMRSMNQEFQFRASNFSGMMLAKMSPILGYVLAKFMQSDIFERFKDKFVEKIGSMFTRAWNHLTGGSKKFTFGDVLKLPFKAIALIFGVMKSLVTFPFKVVGTILKEIAKLPFKLIGGAIKLFVGGVKFLSALPFKMIGFGLRALFKTVGFIASIPLKLAALPFKLIGGAFGALKSGMGFPHAQKGGYVKKGGLVNTHAGELIVPADKFLDKMREVFNPMLSVLKHMRRSIDMIMLKLIPTKELLGYTLKAKIFGTGIGKVALLGASLWQNRALLGAKKTAIQSLLKSGINQNVVSAISKEIIGAENVADVMKYYNMALTTKVGATVSGKVRKVSAARKGIGAGGLGTSSGGGMGGGYSGYSGMGDINYPMFGGEEDPTIHSYQVSAAKDVAKRQNFITKAIQRQIANAEKEGRPSFLLPLLSTDTTTKSQRETIVRETKKYISSKAEEAKEAVSKDIKKTVGPLPPDAGLLGMASWGVKAGIKLGIHGLAVGSGALIKGSWKTAGATVSTGVDIVKGRKAFIKDIKEDVSVVAEELNTKRKEFAEKHMGVGSAYSNFMSKNPKTKALTEKISSWLTGKLSKKGREDEKAIVEGAKAQKSLGMRLLGIAGKFGKGLLYLLGIIVAYKFAKFIAWISEVPKYFKNLQGIPKIGAMFTKIGGILSKFPALTKFLGFVGKWGARFVWLGMILDSIKGYFNAKDYFGKKKDEKLSISERISSMLGTAMGGAAEGSWGNAVQQALALGFAGAVAGGPIGALIGAVTGFAAGKMGAKNTSLMLQIGWTALKTGGLVIWKTVKGLILKPITSLVYWAIEGVKWTFTKVFEGWGLIFTTLWNWLTGLPIIGPILSKAGNVFSTAKSWVGEKIGGVKERITGSFKAGEPTETKPKSFTEKLQGFYERQKETLSTLSDSNKGWVYGKEGDPPNGAGIGSSVRPITPIISPGINKGVSTDSIFVAQNIQMLGDRILQGMKYQLETQMGLTPLGAATKFLEKPAQMVTQGVKKIGSTVLSAGKSVLGSGKKIVSGVKEFAVKTGEQAVSFAKNVGSFFGIRPASHVRMEGMHPNFMTDFQAMAKAYKEKTGKDIPVNSAYRDPAYQKKLYDKAVEEKRAFGKRIRVAMPGLSMHEKGWAMDIDSNTANKLASSGMLQEYGFTRPYLKSLGETWHIEPISIQGKRDRVRSGKFIPAPSTSQVGDPVPYSKMNSSDIAKNEVFAQMMPYEMMSKANASGAKGLEDFGKKITSVMTTNMNVTNQILSKGMSNTSNQGASQTGSQDQMLRDILEGNLLA